MREKILNRFLRYVQINTRSDANSSTVPSTQRQYDLLNVIKDELLEMGIKDVFMDTTGVVYASIPSNIDKEVPTIGFIAHVDTADFNAEGVKPKVIENYDGSDIVLNEALNITLEVEMFPNLNKHLGKTLVVTDGTTLLGADDKAGVVEIIEALQYLIDHPEIKHGKICAAFTIDEEIGTGADHFDVEYFGADFAYTIDGGPLGGLEYETFNGAEAKVYIKGVSVHPGSAKDTMINANTVLSEFINLLPQDQRPEHTDGYNGFFLVTEMNATIENGYLELIIRDHDKNNFNNRKTLIREIEQQLQTKYGQHVVSVEIKDQYYNMREIIEKDMTPVNLAMEAMKSLNITPIIEPVRGGTDGSKLSFKGLPTPNLFTGGENYHGKFEYAVLDSMIKASEVIIKIAELNAQ